MVKYPLDNVSLFFSIRYVPATPMHMRRWEGHAADREAYYDTDQYFVNIYIDNQRIAQLTEASARLHGLQQAVEAIDKMRLSNEQ